MRLWLLGRRRRTIGSTINTTTSSIPREWPRWRRRSLVAAVVIAMVTAVIAGFVALVYRPAISQWGSTKSERAAAMVGDDIVADADTVWTRAITIDAPSEAVWPWLVQIGVDRGGFYNYDWGEQLFLDPVHNATTIHAEWQHLAAGDVIHPMPGSDWRVRGVDPSRALLLDNPQAKPTDWSWSTELHRLDGDRTRLVTRIRGHKGSFFSYALDVPDLVLFPRLLTGIKQRAEGTLPGMSGTHTGAPFPMARLPVHGWAAGVWVIGLAVMGFALRRSLGFGRQGSRRPHPGITATIAFVAGAGYMIMSDTPPVQFFTRSWLAGLAAAGACGVYLGRRQRISGTGHQHLVPRLVAAVAETGLFIVLPATSVWQAATAKGWTVWAFPDHIVVGAAAVVVSVGVARAAWGWDARGDQLVIATLLAGGYAVTGSGTAALLGAVILEVIAGRHRGVERTLAADLPSGTAVPAHAVHAADTGRVVHPSSGQSDPHRGPVAALRQRGLQPWRGTGRRSHRAGLSRRGHPRPFPSVGGPFRRWRHRLENRP